MIEVAFDKSQFSRLESLLRDAPHKLASAEKSAVTRAAKGGIKSITDAASALLADHRKKTIRSRIILRPLSSSGNHFRAEISMPFRPIGLIHFGARQDASGVTATAGAFSVTVPHAFIARGRAKSGRGARIVFIRQPGARHVQHIGRSGQQTWSAQKIRPVYGPTLAGLLERGGISGNVYPAIQARLNKELDGQIGRFWRSHGK